MNFSVSIVLPATAKEIYETWLSSEGHSNMTGGEAIISDKIGEKFTAWDDYIEGQNLILEPYKRIVQSWRTSQFEKEEEDSQIEILLSVEKEKTRLTLNHSKVPESGEHYIKGWEEHYFNPMTAYFEKFNS